MPIKLKNLIIDRVDLVGKGDNPSADIAFYKRDRNDSDSKDDEATVDAFINKIVDKLTKRKGDEQPMFDFKKFVAELNDQPLADRLDKLSDDQQNSISGEVEKESDTEVRKTILSSLVRDFEKDNVIKSLESEIQAYKDAAKKAEEDEDEDEEDDEDVMKGLPESVRKIVEESNKRAEEAEKLAKRLNDEKDLEKYVQVAKSFNAVVTEPTKVGAVLKNIADNNKDDFGVIESVLKASNEALERNNILMKELGTDHTENDGNVWQKIENEAKDIMKSDTKISKEQAISKVLRDNPSLYKDYQKEINEEV